MKIYFEEYHYKVEMLKSEGGEFIVPQEFCVPLNNNEIKFTCVGYLYSNKINDVVFILPKVFLNSDEQDKNLKVFGKVVPEDLITLDSDSELFKNEPRIGNFIFELSTWLYQSISRYHKSKIENCNIKEEELQNVIASNGNKSKTSIEIVLALIDFAKKHRRLLAYQTIISNYGFKKIHWNKTISKNTAYIKNGKPYYLNFQTKQRTENWNEQLIVLFYSVLLHLNKKYNFSIEIDFNYQLLSEREVNHLIESGRGLRLLRKIRKNYFVAEFVLLWKLLYAYFDWQSNIQSNRKNEDYLLIKEYNCVFEHMIDVLLGSDEVSENLKNLKDGKRIDHIYRYDSLLPRNEIYYIGDSKYYKETNDLGQESLYKQFTYAKNIIQHHIDLYYNKGNDEKSKIHSHVIKYRDDLTQGYNITPNFFIRGFIPDNEQLNILNSKLELTKTDEKINVMKHFQNRLFDRDTLFTQSYNINFLFVLSYYVHHLKDESLQKNIRHKFKNNFLELINEKYNIFNLLPKYGNKEANEFIKNNFYDLNGKVISPFEGLYFLALEKATQEDILTENQKVLEKVEEAFVPLDYKLGSNVIFGCYTGEGDISLSNKKEEINSDILLGFVRSEEQKKWIEKNKLYNIRFDDRDGSVKNEDSNTISNIQIVILYDKSNTINKIYSVKSKPIVKSVSEMEQLEYPFSKDFDKKIKSQEFIGNKKYLVYTLEETIEFGDKYIDCNIPNALLNVIEGAPIFISKNKFQQLMGL